MRPSAQQPTKQCLDSDNQPVFKQNSISFAFASAVFAMLTACSGYSATGGPGPLVSRPFTSNEIRNFDASQVRDVIVLPLQGEVLAKTNQDFQERIHQKLSTILALESGLEVRNISEKSTNETLKSLLAKDEIGNKTPLGQARRVNEILKPDGVFYGVLSHYEGAAKGTGIPSRVAFRIWFLPQGETEAVWTGSYEYLEKPLSENLFRINSAFKSGIVYRGAERLLTEGFEDLAREFERYRLGPRR